MAKPLTGHPEGFNLTDPDRVRLLSSSAGAMSVPTLEEMIEQVSGEFLVFLDRHVLKKDRTEEYQLKAGSRLITTRSIPIDDAATVQVWHAEDRKYSDNALESTLYTVDPGNGIIRLEFEQRFDPAYVKVRCTGGMALSLDDLDTMPHFRPLIGAATRQVRYLMSRRDTLGGQIRIPRGGVSHEFDSSYGWLADVRSTLARFQR